MNNTFNINIKVSEAAYLAFQSEADKEGYFIAGLFRQFLADVLRKHEESAAGILPPVKRHTSKAKSKVSPNFQLSAAFEGRVVPQAVTRVYMREVLRNAEKQKNEANQLLSDSTNLGAQREPVTTNFSKALWLSGELRDWLEARGHVFTLEEIKPKNTKK